MTTTDLDRVGNSKNLSHGFGGNTATVSGKNGIAIYGDDGEEKYFIRTEFEVRRSIFSESEDYFICLDKEGFIRAIESSPKDSKPIYSLEDTHIYDAVASRDGRYFAAAKMPNEVLIYHS